MAEDQVGAQPTKATKATTGRATMAPTARDPQGSDAQAMRDRQRQRAAGMADELEGLDDATLDELDSAVRNERRRRAGAPRAPRFGLSEGERADLELHGQATSPFTGERLEGDGAPGGDVTRTAPGEKTDGK